MHVKNRVDKRGKKNEILLTENKISNNSFERRQFEVETWSVKVNRQIEIKKNKLITLYGGLENIDEIMKRSKRTPKNASQSDSEIKLSEDMSHYSEISNRHERRNSGYLKKEERNHIPNEHRVQTDLIKNKLIDRVSGIKDCVKILSNKDHSISTQGQVLVPGYPIPIPNKDNDSTNEKESELIPKSIKNDQDEEKSKSRNLENYNEGDLVAFPSDNEISNKQRKDVIEDINSFESDPEFDKSSDKDEEHVSEKAIVEFTPPENISPKIEMVKQRDNKNIPSKSIQKPDDEDWPSGFPSLADGKNNQNLDLFDDIIDPQKDDFQCDGDLVESKSTDHNKSQDKKLEASSLKSEPQQEILLESNIDDEEPVVEDDKRSISIDDEESKPFSDEEQLKNVVETTSDIGENDVPTMPEPSPIKPLVAPSIMDIMNDDLTGAWVVPATKSK
jgi:hypothetical protein